MSTSSSSGVIATLVLEFRTSGRFGSIFPKILYKFKPDIRRMAAAYPEFWRPDFEQEGAIGLSAALQQFPAKSEAGKFIPYACTTIRRKMYDFYNQLLRKEKVTLDSPTIDDPTAIVNKQASSPTSYIITGIEAIEEYENIADPATGIDHVENYIDVSVIFNPVHLKANRFTDQEIVIVQLYFRQEVEQKAIAEICDISESQTSKVISSLKPRLKKLFTR